MNVLPDGRVNVAKRVAYHAEIYLAKMEEHVKTQLLDSYAYATLGMGAGTAASSFAPADSVSAQLVLLDVIVTSI